MVGWSLVWWAGPTMNKQNWVSYFSGISGTMAQYRINRTNFRYCGLEPGLRFGFFVLRFFGFGLGFFGFGLRVSDFLPSHTYNQTIS